MADLSFTINASIGINNKPFQFLETIIISADRVQHQNFVLDENYAKIQDYETAEFRLYDRHKLLIVKNNHGEEKLYLKITNTNDRVATIAIDPGSVFISTMSSLEIQEGTGEADIKWIEAAFPITIVGDAELFMVTLEPLPA